MTSIPLVFSFWFMLAAYVVHIIDESLFGGSFVEKVQQHWWPQYSWHKFFGFNAGYLALMAKSVVLYDRIGSRLVFLPLAWAIERFFNAIWHFWWAVHFREYPPGLLTSLLILIESYWIVFCRPVTRSLSLRSIWPGVVLGILAAIFLSFYMAVDVSHHKEAGSVICGMIMRRATDAVAYLHPSAFASSKVFCRFSRLNWRCALGHFKPQRKRRRD